MLLALPDSTVALAANPAKDELAFKSTKRGGHDMVTLPALAVE
ncbi:MAG: hypothetical protein ACKVS9_15350 [Phycisphaerae bacterium]